MSGHVGSGWMLLVLGLVILDDFGRTMLFFGRTKTWLSER
jgi:hypothetical protein